MLKKLSHIADLLNAPLIGGDSGFRGVSSDTRTLKSGELFVALRGPNFSGGEYLDTALKKGAVGAITDQLYESSLPQIVVTDTLSALGMVASAWRDQFDIPLMAITGSNGKTTVKEMVALILAQLGPGTVTKGNLNNDIGVPLTLFNLSSGDRWAVIEMGASALGEIARLSAIAQPTIALVNNVGSAHLGGFGSIRNIARAKGEIYAGLRSDGVALINCDLPQADDWVAMATGREVQTYGSCCEPSLISAVIKSREPFEISYKGESLKVELPLPGEHNKMNALAAAALAVQAGASLGQVKNGLESMQAIPGRLESKPGRGGAVVVDDTYNASPESMMRAVEVLSSMEGRRILVVGDMGELGEDSPHLHKQIGVMAKSAGIDSMYALGSSASEYVSGFGDGAALFEDSEKLVVALADELAMGRVILVKGSRFMKMEQIVRKITVKEADDQS